MFAFTQPINCFNFRSIASKLKSAHALDRNNLTALQQGAHRIYRIQRGHRVQRNRGTIGSLKPCSRAAGIAGYWLRMEATISRILILGATGRAHRKRAHRGARAVIRNAFDDRQPWAAMRAIGERIAIAPRERIEDFYYAFGAGGSIGDDTGLHARCLACDDVKRGVRWKRRRCFAINAIHARQWWRFLSQRFHKGINPL